VCRLDGSPTPRSRTRTSRVVIENEKGPRRLPRSLSERPDSTLNSNNEVYRKWRPCSTPSCPAPAVKTLGTLDYCELHLRPILVPIRRKQAYERHDVGLGFDLGVGIFQAPAYSFPAPYVVLICDLDDCGATWVGQYATFDPCPFCLDRAIRSRV